MVIVEVAGGLGNQLQQYALYKKLESMGADVRLDLTWFSEKEQNRTAYKREPEFTRISGISYDACTEEERRKLLGSDSLFQKAVRKLKGPSKYLFTEKDLFHPELLEAIRKDPNADLYIRGFFACESYYADLLPSFRASWDFDLQNDPKLTTEQKERIRDLAEKIDPDRSVSIHLRRGDYLDEANTKLFGGICTDAYYETAIRHAKEHLDPPEPGGKGGISFYVFSDDPAYAREFAKRYASHSPTDSGDSWTVMEDQGKDAALYDSDLMRRCRVNICANSTFSFWGARLNPHPDKCMIRPTIHKNTQSFDGERMKELWPGWTFVSPEGILYDFL